MAWTTATTRVGGFVVTAAVWNAEHVNNLKHLERVAIATKSSDVSVTVTTVATAIEVLSLGAVTYEAVSHTFELYIPNVNQGASGFNTYFVLKDGSTVLGTIGRLGNIGQSNPVYLFARVTPTAASHTYSVAAWNSSAGTATCNAGTGGAAGDTSTDLSMVMIAKREIV